MRLKNVRIQGFKSFMKKIDINISPGISAFVGPNGCGKSNVVDAIRWAMGEQSSKQLRGRQMEDLIFSGAGNLKPLGMAEVTLTLEDTKGLYDDNEISITRRLYRSNESDYLINNSPCRLRDIQDLFLGTGLGNRSYSFIAQGEISSLIEQKPEDTRLILEEAAGISKYKVKREASLRKINLTRENLRRVEDIFSEIKRDMNSLKRQAKKAIRFKEVSSEIRRLELVLYANTYNELIKEREDKTELINNIMEKERDLEELFSKSEREVEAVNMMLIEKEKVLSSVKESIFSLREEGRKSKDALEHLLVDRERFIQIEKRLNDERYELEKKISGFQGDVEKINSRVKDLQRLIKEISVTRSQYDSRFREERILLDRMKSEIQQDRSQLNELTTNEARLDGEIKSYSEAIHQLNVRKVKLEQESGEISERIEGLSYRLKEEREKSEEKTIKLRSIEKSSQEQNNKRIELENLKREKDTQIVAEQSELNLFLSQKKTLRGLIENYEGYQSGVQTIMNSYKKGNGKAGKVLGVLTDFIHVEPEFETAVEAVLSEKLQYIIVTQQEDGKNAVEYLRSKSIGRSYFLPVKEFEEKKFFQKDKTPLNGFKLLREHICIEEKFRPLIETLLGNAALVPDLSQAIYSWNNGFGRQTLVTPEGDLVNENGVIIGGKLGEDSTGLLKRRREESELNEMIKVREKSISSLQKNIDQLGQKLSEINSVIEQLENSRKDYGQEIELLNKDILLHERESEQIIGNLEHIQKEVRLLDDEFLKKRHYRKNIDKELSECIERRKSIKDIIEAKEGKLEEVENALDTSKEDLSRMILQHNQFNEEERGLVREEERIVQFMSEMDSRMKKIETEINSNKVQFETSLRTEEEIKEGLSVIHKKEKELEHEVNGIKNEYDALKDALREKERNTALLREDISRIREKINEQRLKQAEIDFKIKSTISQAGRDTGIDLQKDYKDHLRDDFSGDECEQKLKENIDIKEKIGDVNLLAISEYEKLEIRYEFIKEQREDLLSSINSLNNAIRRINMISKKRFLLTLDRVNEKLKEVFPVLFGGGKADLRLIDESLPLESGVVFEVQPPGKKLVHMALLSGGEKALSAIALLFAMYLIKPSPFIIMDEADAPLDEANTDKFNGLLKDIANSSQIIMVTHNRRAMEIVDRLYGITMDKQNISKIVSVEMSDYR